MAVLDTDVLIDFMRDESHAVAFIEEAVRRPEPLAVSAVTIMQLHHGIQRARAPAEEAFVVTETLERFTMYAFDAAAAATAGRILGQLSTKGRALNLPDVMIGATALARGEPVVTRNVRDFSRIPGLALVEP